MKLDLNPFFEKYERLLSLAQETFERVRRDYPDCVTCKTSCADCCHALFDLSLIEALYINYHFNRAFKGVEKQRRLEIANRIDRRIYQLKKEAYKALQAGRDEQEILAEMAQKRVRCPLLRDDDTCDLYAYRPVTCRIYGIPTSIGGRSHTCGLSAFQQGRAYPTVTVDIFQKKLFELSEEVVRAVQSRYTRKAEMLVPLSMALLTEYDETYLGITAPGETAQDAVSGD